MNRVGLTTSGHPGRRRVRIPSSTTSAEPRRRTCAAWYMLIAVSVLGVALVVAAGALLAPREDRAPASPAGRPGHRPDRRRPTSAPAPAERLEDLGGARPGVRATGPDHRGPGRLPARRGGARPVAGDPAGGQRDRADRPGRARRRPPRLPGRAAARPRRARGGSVPGGRARRRRRRPDRAGPLRRGVRDGPADGGSPAGCRLVRPGVVHLGTARRRRARDRGDAPRPGRRPRPGGQRVRAAAPGPAGLRDRRPRHRDDPLHRGTAAPARSPAAAGRAWPGYARRAATPREPSPSSVPS